MIAFLVAALTVADPNAAELKDALAMLDRLETSVVSVDYQNQPLQKIIDDLGTTMPIPVRADWKSLERLGIEPSHRVTFAMEHSRAAAVLGSLAFSLGDDLERPVFEAYSGQMVLTTVAGTSAMRLTDAYDVRDLLANAELVRQLQDEMPAERDPAPAPPPPHVRPALSDPAQHGPEAEPPPVERQPRIFDPANLERPPLISDPPPVPQERPNRTPGEKLIMLITDHVDADAWMNFGGDRGLITEINGVLMITAPPTTHRKLRTALRALRAANPASISIDAAIIDLSRTELESLERQYGRDASGLAAAALASAERGEGKLLWRGSNGVACDGKLDIESSSDPTQIRLALAPTFDRANGLLRITIEASSKAEHDRRTVKTTLSLAADQNGALVELAGAAPGASQRFVVLRVRR